MNNIYFSQGSLLMLTFDRAHHVINSQLLEVPILHSRQYISFSVDRKTFFIDARRQMLTQRITFFFSLRNLTFDKIYLLTLLAY